MGVIMNRFLFITVFCFIFVSCANRSDYHPVISFITGAVSVNGTPVQIGIAVHSNDRVETGEASSCEILLNDKSILRLGAATIVRFQPEKYMFDLEKGWFSGLARKHLFKADKFRVKTPTVIASVRGTSFCVKTESPDSTYFCVCNGVIDLEDDRNANFEKVAASHHTARRYLRIGDKISVEKPELKYHSDKDIEHLANAIHENIDWTKAE